MERAEVSDKPKGDKHSFCRAESVTQPAGDLGRTLRGGEPSGLHPHQTVKDATFSPAPSPCKREAEPVGGAMMGPGWKTRGRGAPSSRSTQARKELSSANTASCLTATRTDRILKIY